MAKVQIPTEVGIVEVEVPDNFAEPVKNGYLRTSDYTKKQQKVAEERRAVAEEAARLAEDRAKIAIIRRNPRASAMLDTLLQDPGAIANPADLNQSADYGGSNGGGTQDNSEVRQLSAQVAQMNQRLMGMTQSITTQHIRGIIAAHHADKPFVNPDDVATTIVSNPLLAQYDPLEAVNYAVACMYPKQIKDLYVEQGRQAEATKYAELQAAEKARADAEAVAPPRMVTSNGQSVNNLEELDKLAATNPQEAIRLLVQAEQAGAGRSG